MDEDEINKQPTAPSAPSRKQSSSIGVNINYKDEDLQQFTHVFLVMECVESDMKKLLSCTPPMAL